MQAKNGVAAESIREAPVNIAERIRLDIVRPVISQMGYWTAGAEELLMMISAHESQGFMKRRQDGGGPAKGLCQMEPVAFNDLLLRYFPLRPEIRAAVLGVLPPGTLMSFGLLEADDRFAFAMARVHFLKVPEPIPPCGDMETIAAYAKKFWNSMAGKATPEKYLSDYQRYVLGEVT